MFGEYVTGLQEYADEDFADTFTAHASVWTEVDGLEQETWAPQGETPGKVSGRSREGDTNTRTATIGGVERPVIEGGLHIPIGAFLNSNDELMIQPGWEFTCTAVGPHSDPSLLGRSWRVVDIPAKSYATARRLDVVEVP